MDIYATCYVKTKDYKTELETKEYLDIVSEAFFEKFGKKISDGYLKIISDDAWTRFDKVNELLNIEEY